MAKLPKPVYRFNVIPMKLPMTFFKELEQIILKIYMESHKQKKNCQKILGKRTKLKVQPSQTSNNTTK